MVGARECGWGGGVAVRRVEVVHGGEGRLER